MNIDERLRRLNALPAAEFRRLVEGYTRIANDLRVTRDDRLRARKRLRLLQLSEIQWRLGEVATN